MIKIICGPKGAGKTKELIDVANRNAENQKGFSIFVTDTKRYMYDLSRSVNFIDTQDFGISGTEEFAGFIKGIVATAPDMEYIYVDGIAKMCGSEIDGLGETFSMLDKLAGGETLTIYVTCSCQESELPDFAKEYL